MARLDLPSGTVTFLFTDVEGSTKLLHALGPQGYAEALGEHRRVLRDAFTRHGGVEVDTQGDAFFVAFPTAPGALAAAARARDALAAGPIKVRIGLHTGSPHLTDEGYVGTDVHRAARIGAAGHGGQVLLSRETRERLGDGEFVDLGEHRLKDFATPVWIFQLGSDGFPPLKTIANTNLPRPASPLIGRERELDQLTAMLRGPQRFVTVTGPGGAGKTRLAIEAATRLVAEFRSGVFWVDAAPLREPALVMDAIGLVLGASGDLAEHVGEREMLLVVDNLEQVVAAGAELATLVEQCARLRVMTTSRERLRVHGEHDYRMPTLGDAAAAALFSARSGAEPAPEIAELCRALDNLPLAIELAAARASVLSPRQILERLDERLDLFRGGRDADPRQATLRATIDWSHELLADDERALFARLSVFAGGADLDAVEAVAGADLGTLSSLVDKSLVRHVDERFTMLESIRDYAADRLRALGELPDLRRRHADHYLALAERCDATLEAGEPEEGPVAILDRENGNLRAAVEYGLEAGDTDLVRRITAALPMYWIVRGRYGEARAWLERAADLDAARDPIRRRLLSALAIIAYQVGDHGAAVAAADAAAALASELAGAAERIAMLRDQAIAAMMRHDHAVAESLFTERLALAQAAENGVATSSCRLNLATIANETRRHDRADAFLAENLPFVRSRGQSRCEAHTLMGMAQTALYRERHEAAGEPALRAAMIAVQIGDVPLTLACLEAFAVSIAARGDPRAALILGGTERQRELGDMAADEEEAATRSAGLALLGDDPASYAAEWEHGRALDVPALLEAAASIGANQAVVAA